MKKFSTSVLSVATLAVLSTACVKIESLDPVKAITKTFESKKKKKSTRIVNSPGTNEQVSVGSHNLNIVSADVLRSLKASGKLISASHPKAKKFMADLPSTEEIVKADNENAVSGNSMIVGFPKTLLGEQNVMGAVITKVSDKKNETLGSLKLTDLPPIHGRTVIGRAEVISRDEEGNILRDASGKPKTEIVPAVVLKGCANACNERSQQIELIPLPIKEIDDENGIFYLDMRSLGDQLDLMSLMDPDGEYTKLITAYSETTEFNYDLKTLLFDIKSIMVPKGTTMETLPDAPITEITVRWYMKLSSGFDPSFEPRSPTPAVGFFETSRNKATKITRFAIPDDGTKIHYYIKNVPAEYEKHFTGAIDNWNKKFLEAIGTSPLSYTVVKKTDAIHPLLVPGDIRFNIIEWDEDNKAPYGGLGPSVAHQFTGQTMSANVLIQGPNIVEMYTKWFELSKDIRALRSAGQVAEANSVIRKFSAEAKAKVDKLASKKFSVSLGEKLAFRVNSQRPELEDPMIKNHFEVVPAGVTFEEYMKGYFTEMLEHELGHNLGLRHNFKGNLGSTDSGQSGSASRSIMEYLGRPYRHLNEIGLYDEMAIRYGYVGEAPKRANWFCTDEHQAAGPKNIATASPECSKSDATSDPFSFWESRVKRALDLVVDLKSSSAPVWKTEEVATQVQEFTIAFANYAAAAERTAETWTNFFGKADRPEEKSKVKPYVLTKLKSLLCDPALADAVKAKESQEAQTLTQENLDKLRTVVVETNKALNVFTEAELKCN